MFRLFGKKKVLLALAVILLLVFLSSFWPALWGNFFSKVTSPFQAGFNTGSQKIYNFFETLFSLTTLHRENKALKEENLKLTQEIIKFKEEALENEALRAQLNQELEKGMELLMARVIGREPQNLGQYILVNKGLREGVRVGMSVVDKAGCLVGKIGSVFSNTARAMLITDPNSSINALLQESRATGIVKGKYGLGLLMDLIPQDEEINENHIVITSGLGGEFPQGIFIGKVGKIIEREAEVFKKAWVKPAADFNHLERVFVILEH